MNISVILHTQKSRTDPWTNKDRLTDPSRGPRFENLSQDRYFKKLVATL